MGRVSFQDIGPTSKVWHTPSSSLSLKGKEHLVTNAGMPVDGMISSSTTKCKFCTRRDRAIKSSTTGKCDLY